jgi:hypothetical protein
MDSLSGREGSDVQAGCRSRLSVQRDRAGKDILRLLLFSALENLGYRQAASERS